MPTRGQCRACPQFKSRERPRWLLLFAAALAALFALTTGALTI